MFVSGSEGRKTKENSYPQIGKYLYAICYLGLLRFYRQPLYEKMKSYRLAFPFEALITALFQKEKIILCNVSELSAR